MEKESHNFLKPLGIYWCTQVKVQIFFVLFFKHFICVAIISGKQ